MKIGNDQNELQRICCEVSDLYGQMCQLEIGIQDGTKVTRQSRNIKKFIHR